LSPCHLSPFIFPHLRRHLLYNQGGFIGRTIESVLAQKYPNLEHLVVDGMSTDTRRASSPAILTLRVFRAPDHGQADAINKGFRLATGDILCFLNSDDIFYPGTLERVAQEMHPAQGRHIVMGRCRFIDENDQPTVSSTRASLKGIAGFSRSGRVTPSRSRRCSGRARSGSGAGRSNERERLVLDYDLFCRFSKHYPFHVVDQVFAGYRLHAQSKTCSSAGQEYWRNRSGFAEILGSVLRPQYCACSAPISASAWTARQASHRPAAASTGGVAAAAAVGRRLAGAGWPDVCARRARLRRAAAEAGSTSIALAGLARSALPTARRACADARLA